MKKFLIIILVLFSIVSLIIIGYTIYYFKTTDKTIIRNINVNDLTYSEKERFPFEVNMFSNKNKNGTYCYEVAVNTYTNASLPKEDKYKNVYSAGIQSLEKLSYKNFTELTGFLNLGDCFDHTILTNAYYYNTDINAELSYTAIKELPYYSNFIFDSDGILFTLNPGINYKLSSGLWITAWKVEDMNSFLYDLEESVLSLPDGDYIVHFDISKYFTWALTSEDNTSTETKPINKTLDFTMFNIKIHKSSNGLIKADQSLFKCVKGDPNYTDVESITAFGGAETNYHINEFNFEILFTGSEFNYEIKLKEEVYNFLLEFPKLNLIVDINLDSCYFDNKYCSAFSIDAFRGLKIKQCNITCSNIFLSKRIFNVNGNSSNFVLSNVSIVGGKT